MTYWESLDFIKDIPLNVLSQRLERDLIGEYLPSVTDSKQEDRGSGWGGTRNDLKSYTKTRRGYRGLESVR